MRISDRKGVGISCLLGDQGSRGQFTALVLTSLHLTNMIPIDILCCLFNLQVPAWQVLLYFGHFFRMLHHKLQQCAPSKMQPANCRQQFHASVYCLYTIVSWLVFWGFWRDESQYSEKQIIYCSISFSFDLSTVYRQDVAEARELVSRT